MSEKLLQEMNIMITRIDARVSGINSKVSAIDQSLNGTPDAPERGVKIRLDRLEQSECSKKWSFRLLISAIIALIVAYITERVIK